MTRPHCDSRESSPRRRRTSLGYRTSACRACRRVFNERTGTPFNDLQYPTDIILLTVLWRLRYKLGLRDVAELLLERGYLEACLRPDEVVSVGIDDVGHPGLGVVRRGSRWCECTVDWRGSAKLYFPLSRSAMIATLAGAIPPGAGAAENGDARFAFVGSVTEAFVLSVLARELREDPRAPTLAELAAAVVRSIDRPSLSLGFQLLGGPEVPDGLRSAAVVAVVVGGLQARDLVTLRGDRVVLAAAAAAALGGFPDATFAINRTVVTEAGARSHWLHATKAGERTIVFRPRSPEGGEQRLEWREVGNDDLRLLVAGLLLNPTAVEAGA